MGRKAKLSFEVKYEIVMKWLAGESYPCHESRLLGINSTRVLEWISIYESLGKEGVITSHKNAVYNQEELKASGAGGTPAISSISFYTSRSAICRFKFTHNEPPIIYYTLYYLMILVRLLILRCFISNLSNYFSSNHELFIFNINNIIYLIKKVTFHTCDNKGYFVSWIQS